MNTELWEPMVYRTKVGPAMKIIHWPHDGYWQLVLNDKYGVAHGIGQFASAEEAAASLLS